MERKALAKKIWAQCFQDSAEEIDFYFENIFQEEYWKVYEENNQVLASLHENPYRIQWEDFSDTYPYFVGVATLPEDRGKSYMTKLLFQEFTRLKQSGVDFCFLTPINPILYRSFGFEYFSSLEEYSFKTSSLAGFTREQNTEIIEVDSENFRKYAVELVKIYKIASLGYFSSLQREEKDFQRLLKEQLLSGGKLYLFFQNTRAAAYLFVRGEEEKLVVRECFASNPKAYETVFFFLKSFREYYPNMQIQAAENLHLEYYLPNQKEVEKKFLPFMMGRILSPKTFLRKCKLLAPSVHIFIEDPVLIENTGFYTLDEEISFTQTSLEDYDFSIGIRELVPLCFGFFSFQDLLRLGKIKLHSVEQLELLQQLFSKKFNFFHEYW